MQRPESWLRIAVPEPAAERDGPAAGCCVAPPLVAPAVALPPVALGVAVEPPWEPASGDRRPVSPGDGDRPSEGLAVTGPAPGASSTGPSSARVAAAGPRS